MSDKIKCYIFIGPPGAGKGSLSSICMKKLGWKQLSTGNLCRKHIAEQSEIGKQIDFAIKSGKLIEDSLILDMVSQWLQKYDSADQNIIFDGFPRTVVQAQSLVLLLRKKFPDALLYTVQLHVSRDRIVERICHRSMCGNKECQVVYSTLPGSSMAPERSDICDVCGSALIRRSDDTQEAIVTRLEKYYESEQSLIDCLDQYEVPKVRLDAGQNLEDVFTDFKDNLRCIEQL